MVLEKPRFESIATTEKTGNIEGWRDQLKAESEPIVRHGVYKNFSLIYETAQQIALAHWNLGKKSKVQSEQIRITDIFYQSLKGGDNNNGDFRRIKSAGLLVISTLTASSRRGTKGDVLSSIYLPKTNSQQNLILLEAFKDRRFWWDKVSLGVPEIDGGKIVEVYNASLKGKRGSLRSLRAYETNELFAERYGFQEILLAKVVDIDLMEEFLEAQKIIGSQVRDVDYPKTESFETYVEEDFSYKFSRVEKLLFELHDRLNNYSKRKKKLIYVDRAARMIRKADLSKLVEVRKVDEAEKKVVGAGNS